MYIASDKTHNYMKDIFKIEMYALKQKDSFYFGFDPYLLSLFLDNKNQGVIGNADQKPVDLTCMLTLNKAELERSRIENDVQDEQGESTYRIKREKSIQKFAFPFDSKL